MSENRLNKTVKLNKNGDFRRAYSRGKSFVDPALVTYVTKNRAGICRIGITATKKIGNAVTRNRSKRVIRAAYSGLKDSVKSGGYDLVFVARSRTAKMKSYEVEQVMLRHLRKSGLIEL